MNYDKKLADGVEYEPHEIESAAHHLMKAEEIKQNKVLHGHVIAHLAKQKKAITSIQGLRDRARSLDKEGSPAEEAKESPSEEAAETAKELKKSKVKI